MFRRGVDSEFNDLRGETCSDPIERDSLFGYRGQKFVKSPIIKPVPPMVYLPRGVDNSAGGQAYIDSQRWGPCPMEWSTFRSVLVATSCCCETKSTDRSKVPSSLYRVTLPQESIVAAFLPLMGNSMCPEWPDGEATLQKRVVFNEYDIRAQTRNSPFHPLSSKRRSFDL